MKKVAYLILLSFCAVFLFSACNEVIEQPESSEEYIEIPLSIKLASVSITDEPMTRASSESIVYAIEFDEINPNTGEVADYAYGFFSSIDGLKVKLNKARKYSVKAAVYYNYFENNVDFYATTGSSYIYYQSPINDFVYIKEGWFYGITAWHKKNQSYYTTDLIPCDTYYKEIESFDPTTNTSCSLQLDRMSAGIEVVVEGLTEGYVKFELNSHHTNESLSYTLTKDNNSINEIFCFSDLLYKSPTNVRMYATYYYPSGESVSILTDYGSFTRGMRKKLKITLSKENQNEVNESLSVSWAKTDMSDEDLQVYNCVI